MQINQLQRSKLQSDLSRDDGLIHCLATTQVNFSIYQQIEAVNSPPNGLSFRSGCSS